MPSKVLSYTAGSKRKWLSTYHDKYTSSYCSHVWHCWCFFTPSYLPKACYLYRQCHPIWLESISSFMEQIPATGITTSFNLIFSPIGWYSSIWTTHNWNLVVCLGSVAYIKRSTQLAFADNTQTSLSELALDLARDASSAQGTLHSAILHFILHFFWG